MLFKVIIVGDSGVGKTNLLTCFCEGVFKDNYVATIGVDFKIKMLQVDEKRVKMQIWDTAGQERFRNITQTYYKGAAGIVLAYSISDNRSYTNITTWIKQIENNASDDVCKILLGTKSDLQEERQVTYEEGNVLAKKYNMQFLEVSAKTGINVYECFTALAREIKEKRDQIPKPTTVESSNITVNGLKPKKKKNCEC